ncbi:MAG: hypothetical protein ACI8ZH_001184 [Flavobacteriales bacterium]
MEQLTPEFNYEIADIDKTVPLAPKNANLKEKEAVTKLLPYSIGKIKAYEEIEEIEPISIHINFVDTKEEE